MGDTEQAKQGVMVEVKRRWCGNLSHLMKPDTMMAGLDIESGVLVESDVARRV